jgi:hypothetical protein
MSRPYARRVGSRGAYVRRLRPNPHDELRFVRGTLYTPDEVIPLKQIGKGAFSTAYVEKNPPASGGARVFVLSADNVYDKELLAMAHDEAPRNPHLPAVERFGHTHDRAVFTMPLYKSPLRKDDDPVGWRDYLVLKKCRDDAYAPAYGGAYKRGRSGYEINEAVYDCAEARGVRPSLLEALRVLIDTAANYGAEYVFEFSPRNLATYEGRLVLLDVLYDREALERQRVAAMKRRVGNVW